MGGILLNNSMPGPYDYTVNIPQPPAQNFLQSLMGIQQLQGLQQQQDIQQQQAQFQAQMQPLQIQTEQARLGQIGQATATGAETLRQSKITFEQGQQDRVRGMEQQSIAQAQTQKIFGEIQALPASASIEEITKKVNMLTLINPTAAKQIGENFNQLQKQYQENAKLTAAKAGALLDAGEYEKAAAVYAQAADAVEANAGDNEILKNLANGYKIQANLSTANPVGAKSAVASLLGVVDPAALNAITAARKQEAETPMKAAELEGKLLENRLAEQKLTGGLDPQERFKAEAAERVHIEATQFVRGYVAKREAFDMIKTADPDASGDETILTQFVKMGDPGSVVSVTEKGGTKNVTVGDYIDSLRAKLTNEGSLSEPKRKELKNQAFQMLKASEKGYKEYQDKLEPVYKERGLNPKNIFVLPSSEQLREDAKKVEMSPEEQRARNMLRPAAGFGNTMTPSTMQPPASPVGMPPEVKSLLNKYR